MCSQHSHFSLLLILIHRVQSNLSRQCWCDVPHGVASTESRQTTLRLSIDIHRRRWHVRRHCTGKNIHSIHRHQLAVPLNASQVGCCCHYCCHGFNERMWIDTATTTWLAFDTIERIYRKSNTTRTQSSPSCCSHSFTFLFSSFFQTLDNHPEWIHTWQVCVVHTEGLSRWPP